MVVADTTMRVPILSVSVAGRSDHDRESVAEMIARLMAKGFPESEAVASGAIVFAKLKGEDVRERQGERAILRAFAQGVGASLEEISRLQAVDFATR